MTRDQSMRSAASNLANNTSWRWSQTPNAGLKDEENAVEHRPIDRAHHRLAAQGQAIAHSL